MLKGTGAAVLGAGAGSLLSACGSSLKGSGSSSSGKIVVGFVSPQTGALAGFASGDNFVVDRVRQASAYSKGFQVGGKTFSVEIVVKDTQVNPNRASEWPGSWSCRTTRT
ncbi:MAG TPA: hypothetical protein VF486_05790 [Actinomycetes bacterium]